MTLNLLHNFKEIGIKDEQYVLFATDQKVLEFFKSKERYTRSVEPFNRDLRSFLPESVTDSANNQGIYGEEPESYGNIGFRAICNEKPLAVLDVLRKGFNVLWTDTDIVWLSDPMDHFNRLNRLHGFAVDDIDLFVQQDDDDICAGFYFIRSNPKTIAYMEKVISFLNPVIDDQIAMRLFLKEDGFNPLVSGGKEVDEKKLKYIRLDRKLFPNGTAYFNLKLPQRSNIQPIIIHNNCIIGHRSKRDRFIEYGLWFVKDSDLEQQEKKSVSEQQSTEKPLKVLKGHFDIITSLNSDKDGKIYSTSIDKSIKIWDYNTGKFKSKYIHKRGAIWSTYVPLKSNDKYSIITSSHDKTIQIWDQQLNSIQIYQGHTGVINQIQVVNDNYILSASDDNTIRVFSIENSEFKRVFLGHSNWVSSIQYNNGILYSSSNDGTIRSWDFSTGRCTNIINANQGWIRKIQINKDNGELISGGNDGSIKIWNFEKSECIGMINAFENSSVSDLVLSNGVIYASSENGEIKSWKLSDRQLYKIYEGHQNSTVNCLHVSESHSLLFSGGFDKLIKSWNL
eukprot:gene4049-5068_t